MSRASSPLRDRMIFLVGARRSGTNWLQRILCARPEVAAVPSETYLFRFGVQQLAERFHQAAPTSPTTGVVYMERNAMLDALRDLCDAVFVGLLDVTAPNASRLVERTPDHVRHLPLMGEIYPDARFVHIIRDGRDVVRSLISQSWGPDTVEEAAEEWRSAIAAAREAAPVLPHYREVRYEELLAGPGRVFADLVSWLGLGSSGDELETVLGEAGARFNVDASAPEIGQGKWRDSFSDDDVETFMRIAGPTLVELGYDEPGLAAPTRAERRRRRRPGVGALRRTKPTKPASRDRGSFEREALLRGRRAQYVLDQVLECISAQRYDRLVGLMDPAGYVRVVAPPVEWEGRGPAAFTRLTEHLAGDPALKGRTVRGDVHASIPTSTAIMSYRLADGSTEDRMVNATVEGGRITRLTYYRLPLAPADHELPS